MPATSISGSTKRDSALVERERDAAAEDRAHDELAFGADVPHVGAIADGEADRAQHDRARLQQELADVVERVDGSMKNVYSACHGSLPIAREQDEADDEHRGGGDDRREPAREARGLGARFEADPHAQRQVPMRLPAGEKRRASDPAAKCASRA